MSYWEDAAKERPGREKGARLGGRQGQWPDLGGRFGQREKYICRCDGGKFKASWRGYVFYVREKGLSLANLSRGEEMED